MLVIKGVSYQFKKESIIDSFLMNIPKHSIYGLLGVNGAGKTTLISCILGLIKFQKGTVLYEGNPLLKADFKDIGIMFDTPSLYPNLNAMMHLKLWGKSFGVTDKRCMEVLEMVGLSTHKKTKRYSMGMKQRLALGIAILNKPKLLILDEPLNGLDPKGIIDFRKIIVDLNNENNTTVLFSSHILAEVEKLATHICVIDKGINKFEGTREEMDTLKTERTYHLKVSDVEKAMVHLSQEFNAVHSIKISPNLMKINIRDKTISISLIIKKLVTYDIAVFEVKETEDTLETLFLNLIKQ